MTMEESRPNEEEQKQPNEPYRDPDDFDIIADEIKRQYGVVADFSQAQVDKIGIMLGFIFVIIIQVSLTNDLVDKPFNTVSGLFVFYLGYVLIGISALIGMTHFFVRKYPIGHDVKLLMDWFKKGESVNYRTKINGKLYLALQEIDGVCRKRSFYMKAMIVYFSVGVLFVVAPRMLGW